MPDADRHALDDREPFDCQACGACCVEAGAVVLGDEDDVPAPLVQRVANLRCMVTEGTSFRCTALLGTIGGTVGCGIYERRPDVCRSFDAGSDECLSARGAMRRKLAEPGPRSPGYEAREMPHPASGLRIRRTAEAAEGRAGGAASRQLPRGRAARQGRDGRRGLTKG